MAVAFMVSLVYVSSAKHPFSDADLVALLRQSREKNTRLDVTGILLYKDACFLQVLEGEERTVHDLYETIRNDPRHSGIIRLLERPIEAREFADWRMAFWNLSDPALREIPGYSEFLNESLYSEVYRNDPSRVRRLIEVFRNSVRR